MTRNRRSEKKEITLYPNQPKRFLADGSTYRVVVKQPKKMALKPLLFFSGQRSLINSYNLALIANLVYIKEDPEVEKI